MLGGYAKLREVTNENHVSLIIFCMEQYPMLAMPLPGIEKLITPSQYQTKSAVSTTPQVV
jgi:hypothetical protein